MKTLFKLTTTTLFSGFVFFLVASSAHAVQTNTFRNTFKQEVKQEVRQEIMEFKNSATPPGETIKTKLRQQTSSLKQNLIDSIKNKVKSLLPHRIHGTLSSITGSTLVVSTDKGDITVYVTEKTQLRRRFGGKSSLDEFKAGDELAVIGSKHKVSETEFSETSIDARYIRNMSIQRRNTVFVGSITAMGPNYFTVQTVSRGTQTVHVDGTTVYQEKNATITFDDLKVGDKVLVKGEIWDRATSEIDAKKIMRLPLVPTPKAVENSSSSSSSTSSAASSASSTSSASSSSASSEATTI